MSVMDIDVDEHRHPDHQIEPLLYHRWSPRSMSGEPLEQEEIHRLFEAARWAPSSYNGQPWRFFYARRDTAEWDLFFDWMVEFNQGWAKNAGLLIVIASRTTFEHNGQPSATHSFDTGAAWQNLALQGRAMGLVVHAMQGFDYDAAKEGLELPDDHAVEVMIAVGRPGKVGDLPEKLRDQEKPNRRKPITETVFEGKYQ
jgi:nitroreductase